MARPCSYPVRHRLSLEISNARTASHTTSINASRVATIGIDIGKNTFHLVGLDQRGAIVLQVSVTARSSPSVRRSEQLCLQHASESGIGSTCVLPKTITRNRGHEPCGRLARSGPALRLPLPSVPQARRIGRQARDRPWRACLRHAALCPCAPLRITNDAHASQFTDRMIIFMTLLIAGASMAFAVHQWRRGYHLIAIGFITFACLIAGVGIEAAKNNVTPQIVT